MSPNVIGIESSEDLIYTPKFKGFKYINDYLSKNRLRQYHEDYIFVFSEYNLNAVQLFKEKYSFLLKEYELFKELLEINSLKHVKDLFILAKHLNNKYVLPSIKEESVGKTTVGSALANSLKYRFIDSGIFYQYLGYLSYQYSDNTENNSKTIEIFKKNMKQDKFFDSITELINSLGNEDYYLSGEEGAKISKNQEAHHIINQYIYQITKEKEFIVVGRDTTFNILPDAEVKIVLSADIDIRVQRHSLQINLTDIKNIFANVLYHYEDIIELKNWELNNAINNDAFAEAFPNIGERIKFIEDLLLYYEARKTIFMLVDRKLPKDRDYEFFEEIIEWKDTVFS
ncbi:18522_t:CDS:2, partial [Dentiscutata erythropus]